MTNDVPCSTNACAANLPPLRISPSVNDNGFLLSSSLLELDDVLFLLSPPATLLAYLVVYQLHMLMIGLLI
jgi:hypothetical protein